MPEGTGKIEFDLKKLKETLQQVGLSRGLSEEMVLIIELTPQFANSQQFATIQKSQRDVMRMTENIIDTVKQAIVPNNTNQKLIVAY